MIFHNKVNLNMKIYIIHVVYCLNKWPNTNNIHLQEMRKKIKMNIH